MHEPNFALSMIPPEDGVAQAAGLARLGGKPVAIADTQDNPGCGGTVDTTGLLKALFAAKVEDAVLGFLCDPAAAHAAGQGLRCASRWAGIPGRTA